MSEKNKNNGFNVGDMTANGDNIISDNKIHVEDKSTEYDIHDNIIQIVSGNIKAEPDKVDRPCLEKYYNERKNNQGKTRIYRFYGYTTGTTRIIKSKNKILTKVLNVITSDGLYVDDHVWLNTKPLKYKKEYNKILKEKGNLKGFIEFEGYVEQYNRQKGSEGTEIIIVSPVVFHADKLESIVNVSYKLINDEKINIYSKYTRNKLFDLVDLLQKDLNELLGYYGENYVFFYIINLIFINTAKENMYKNNITRIPMSDKVIRQIIQTIGSLIYKLDSSKYVTLESILQYITNIVNVLQDINNYDERSEEFNEFCVNELGISEDGRQSEQIWDNVRHRKRNFGDNTNPFNLNKKIITAQAWMVIYNYI